MRKKRLIGDSFGGMVVIVCALACHSVQADWEQWYRLAAPDGAQYDYFGASVGISGDYAVIGAVYNDDAGSNSGSAYIFKPVGSYWVYDDKLTSSDAYTQQNFGRSVCIDGDYAIVGATGDGTTPGAAYIFKKLGGGWSQLGILTASDGVGGDNFGWSVSIDGDRAVVGAHFDDNVRGTDAGSVYYYEGPGGGWATMTEMVKLWAPDGIGSDQLGFSVSISGDYIIAGASFQDAVIYQPDCGAAYIFDRDPDTWIWAYQDKLIASDASAGDALGYSVAIDANYAIIGAIGDDEPGGQEGSAYVFKRSGTTWTEQAKLLASDKAPNDRFGWTVGISGDYAVIGAPFKDANGVGYIFRRSGTTWTELTRLSAVDGAAGDMFGTSVAIDSDAGWAIAGANGKNVGADMMGAAYVFEHICPLADLSGDCYVSYEDLKAFCDAWLDTGCGALTDCPANFDATNDTVDFIDYSILVDQWHLYN